MNLNFLFHNSENLFLLSDQQLTPEHLLLDEGLWQRLSTSVYNNKSLFKLQVLSQMIKSKNPDLILLCEVGGLESLENFNRLFLDQAYSCALIEGNSDRNIDVGFLIKKNLNFYFNLESNKNRPINYHYPQASELMASTGVSLKFSRDVCELSCFTKDKDHPFLMVLLTHLKSRLDKDGLDPEGFERREAELKTLVEIYLEIEAKYPKVPKLVAGDFNGNAGVFQTDPEFKSLYEKTELLDVCELAQKPREQRSTFFQLGKPAGKQIDFCFLSPQLQPFLKTSSVEIIQFLDPYGLAWDKNRLPSDHNPIYFELENLPLG